MKKFAIGLGIVLVIIVAGLFYVSSNLDSIVKRVVESEGSDATGTNVSLGGVELDLVGGKVVFSDLTVANPEGFKSDFAFSLASVSITVDTETLAKDVIVIKEIVIDKPVVSYELVDGSSNLDQIKKNVGGGAPASDEEAADYSGPKFIIEKVRFTGGTVNVSSEGVVEKDMSTELAAFTLSDIGKAKGGATPGEIATELTKALTGSALDAVAKEGVKGLLDKAGDKLKGLFGK